MPVPTQFRTRTPKSGAGVAVRRTTSRDFRGGSAMLNALFGDPGAGDKSFYGRVERDQREGVVADSRKIVTTSRPYKRWPDKWEYIEVNNSRIRGYEGTPYSFLLKMRLGTYANFFAFESDADRDIVEAGLQVLRILVKHSPVLSGLYRSSHVMFLDGKRIGRGAGKQNVTASSYVTIVNQLDYASTIETPEYAKTYRKALTEAWRKMRSDWDIEMRFADPKPFGGNIYGGSYKGRPNVYAIPMLIIAPKNTLPNPGKLAFRERRTLLKRKNPRALRLQKNRRRNRRRR